MTESLWFYIATAVGCGFLGCAAFTVKRLHDRDAEIARLTLALTAIRDMARQRYENDLVNFIDDVLRPH
jgi:uncharacterized membrane protein YhaH (DUF805 family)